MQIVFWCEFPGQVDFKKLNGLINFNVSIYFAADSMKRFSSIKRKIKNKMINVGVWPVLSKKDGYWFSGFTSKNGIDSLDDFSNLDIKIDIEPPIYDGKHSIAKDILWSIKYMAKKGKNNSYLKNKVETMDFRPIISGFLLPKCLRKRYGDNISKGLKNYICYTTFFPIILRYPIRLFLLQVIKRMDHERNMFAIGLTNPGIFTNEHTYESIKEFERDLLLMKNAGVKNLCVYSIEGMLKKENPEEWLNAIKSIFLQLCTKTNPSYSAKPFTA